MVPALVILPALSFEPPILSMITSDEPRSYSLPASELELMYEELELDFNALKAYQPDDFFLSPLIPIVYPKYSNLSMLNVSLSGLLV